jgi:hypothetical protein
MVFNGMSHFIGRGQYILKALDSGISSTNIDLRPPNSPLTEINPLNMTIISNDPMYWPIINSVREWSYFAVASCVVVLYDWGA